MEVGYLTSLPVSVGGLSDQFTCMEVGYLTSLPVSVGGQSEPAHCTWSGESASVLSPRSVNPAQTDSTGLPSAAAPLVRTGHTATGISSGYTINLLTGVEGNMCLVRPNITTVGLVTVYSYVENNMSVYQTGMYH